MKEKIVKMIVCYAEKIAYKSVGKSMFIGVHEIKPPKELLNRKGKAKK